jgi:hypothetical protein
MPGGRTGRLRRTAGAWLGGGRHRVAIICRYVCYVTDAGRVACHGDWRGCAVAEALVKAVAVVEADASDMAAEAAPAQNGTERYSREGSHAKSGRDYVETGRGARLR